jgi:hypothetical protein
MFDPGDLVSILGALNMSLCVYLPADGAAWCCPLYRSAGRNSISAEYSFKNKSFAIDAED